MLPPAVLVRRTRETNPSTSSEVIESIADFKYKKPDHKKVIEFLAKMEFTNLVKRLSKKNNLSNFDIPKSEMDTEKHYKIVYNIKDLKLIINKAINNGVCSIAFFDEELENSSNIVSSFALSYEPGSAVYIPIIFGENKNPHKSNITLSDMRDCLNDILVNSATLKIFYDIKTSMKIFPNISINSYDDLMIMSYSVGTGKSLNSVNDLAKKDLDYNLPESKEIIGTGRDKKNISEIDINAIKEYSCANVDAMLQVYNKLRNDLILKQSYSTHQIIDKPMIRILSIIEQQGVLLDTNVLKKTSLDFNSRLGALEKKIYKEAGREFNIGSPKQLGEIFFDEMGFDGGKKSKSGSWSTSADILEDLVQQDVLIAKLVLDWRQLSKLINTYSDKLPSLVNPNTKRIHTNYLLAGTSTGRLSSNDPNLQNIPIRTEDGRKIRQAFVAPKNSKLISADYSQIELRLLAHIANVPKLNEAFKNRLDIHTMTASQVFSIAESKISSDLRRRAKAINFGIIYGISPYGLAKQLNISNSEAKTYIEKYFNQFPGIKEYMKTQVDFCKKNDYVLTPFGRKIYLYNINDKNKIRQSFAERQAINAPLQGGAADIIKLAMKKISHEKILNSKNCKLLLQVHDELIFEVNDSEVQKSKKLIRDSMENVINLNVPLLVDIGTGQNWNDAH